LIVLAYYAVSDAVGAWSLFRDAEHATSTVTAARASSLKTAAVYSERRRSLVLDVAQELQRRRVLKVEQAPSGIALAGIDSAAELRATPQVQPGAEPTNVQPSADTVPDMPTITKPGGRRTHASGEVIRTAAYNVAPSSRPR